MLLAGFSDHRWCIQSGLLAGCLSPWCGAWLSETACLLINQGLGSWDHGIGSWEGSWAGLLDWAGIINKWQAGFGTLLGGLDGISGWFKLTILLQQ